MVKDRTNKDSVFSEELDRVLPFEFNETVASAFDDMVSRSIPFYDEIHRLILDVLGKTFQGGRIYDLGCSTGTTISIISKAFNEKEIEFIGIDNSKAMLEKCRTKIDANEIDNVTLLEKNIEDVDFESCDVVIMNYTLQFLKVDAREKLLKKIYQSLKPGGVFILSEKINARTPKMQELITDLYYDFKRRNGYSELEIAQKREALENVLIPTTPREQIDQLQMAGFQKTEMMFRWYNFASYLGIK